MEIINHKGEGNMYYRIKGLEGDMGEDTRLDMIQQADGDIVLTMYDERDPGVRFSIEFCTSSGGGRKPYIARHLGQILTELVKENPDLIKDNNS